MNELLGDHWLGKALSYLATAGAAVITALWARKADVGRMVTERWASLSEHQERRIAAAEKRCDEAEEAHGKCQGELAELREQIGELMAGAVPGYVNPQPLPPRQT